MRRAMVIAFIMGAVSVPASAQDMPGAVSLPDLARTQVQSGTARGYAERGGYASRRSGGSQLGAHERRICANAPQYARQWGSDHPKVRGLMATCRQAGFRY